MNDEDLPRNNQTDPGHTERAEIGHRRAKKQWRRQLRERKQTPKRVVYAKWKATNLRYSSV